MRCIRNQTIAIVAVFVGIYFVFPLLLNNRPTVTYVRSGNARVKNNLKSKTLPVWKAVERFENASVQVDGSKTKLVSNLAMKHKKLEKLEVFIVLHSHVDPGWLETFDDYYAHKVDSILNLAVSQLTEHSDLRFIWSEVSFLERWWQTANETQRKRAKKLVAEGRFEICGGSWVMTDEATPYFWASIDDLVEGQRFLTEIFNVTPTTSWSVDPFGHGTMLPFMLPLTGIENLVIGRINNELKGMIRQQSLLNLNWKQSWANVKNGQSKPPLSAYVNILPNKFYTTWDACGPDPGVCCTFDLGPSARYPCSQKANDINAQNVKSYADMLAGQYRKLSKFYRVPSLLVPIGDDFFFSVIEDWTEVYNNYKMVIDYVNKEPSYNMKLRFATPGEFFASIPKKSKASAPSLSGDFFPYLDDRNNGFPAWTAYFAHLPYYKRMGRIVEAKLRSLDLLRIAAAPGSKGLEKLLIDSRRNLALFQHHDGITGTSKKHTMADFLQRLFYAYGNITEVENRLFKAKSKTPFEPLETLSNEANRFLTKKLFSKKKNPVSEIAIFNPLTIRNTRRVVVHSDSPKVKLILGADSKEIQAQVLPHIVDGAVSESVFEILFFVDLEPLAKTEVLLEFVDSQPSSTIISKVHSSAKKPNAAFKELKPGAAFVLKNDLIKAKVMDGKITDIDLQSGKSLDFKFELAKYSDRGGAYVFVPGTRTELPKLKHYFYVSGPLCNQVVSTAESVNITHWISVFLSKDPILDSSLDIEVFSDITKTIGETFMFVMGSGAIENEQTFYTDANGLHMMRRHYNKDESLEMNFYPSPSTSFLEDPKHRLSLLLAQPTAASSLSEGHFEIMVDRQLQGDDGKGLSYGDADTSPPSRLNYRILIEPRKNGLLEKSLFHSALGFYTLQDLLYPVVAMTRPASSGTPLVKWPLSLTEPLPCDVELVTLRSISSKSVLALFRRLPFDPHTSSPIPSDCSGSLESFWNLLVASYKGASFHISNLTGTQKGALLDKILFEALLEEAFVIKSVRIELP